MSLRTLLLDELNALAKQGAEGFPAKLRDVMVDRHPATLDPDEHDPVATAALAWKEVAPRGRPAFAAAAAEVLARMDQARLEADPNGCDWPFAHALLRLLRMIPCDLIDADLKSRSVRRLAGLVAERQETLALLAASQTVPDPAAFWTDAFRLYLSWHEHQPPWLESFWHTALTDTTWPLDTAAFVILEDAARRHPGFVSQERLVDLWKEARKRGTPIEDQRRWFYVTGALLEDSPQGRERLEDLYQRFEAHLQDLRNNECGQPWDHFVKVMSALFRNPDKQRALLDLQTTKVPDSVRERQRIIHHDFKAPVKTVRPELLNSLLRDPAA